MNGRHVLVNSNDNDSFYNDSALIVQAKITKIKRRKVFKLRPP